MKAVISFILLLKISPGIVINQSELNYKIPGAKTFGILVFQ